jgi:hypothetical protein
MAKQKKIDARRFLGLCSTLFFQFYAPLCFLPPFLCIKYSKFGILDARPNNAMLA